MAIEGDIRHLRVWGIQTGNTDPDAVQYFETISMQGNGYLGARGALEEAALGYRNSAPLTLIAGIYDTPAKEHMVTRLAPVPNWLPLRFHDGAELFSLDNGEVLDHRRTLTFRNGLLRRVVRWKSCSGHITRLVFRRIVSMSRPHICAISLSIEPENYSGDVKVFCELDHESWYWDRIPQTDLLSRSFEDGIYSVAVQTKEEGHTIAEAMRADVFAGRRKLTTSRTETPTGWQIEFPVDAGSKYTVEKLVAIHDSMRASDPLSEAKAEVQNLPRFASLRREQDEAWADYWRDADVVVEGDPFAQSVARFFVFQLLQAASKVNVDLNLDVSIGAKCMSGPGYNGHIFWDTELYMLPFYTLEFPEVAEKLLEYRFNRIPQARINAEAEGGRGAKFPWESAGTGIETTPKWLPAGEGKMVRCWTGDREIHVIADVAYGAWRHYVATGDEDFLNRMGLSLILETARYWAYRAQKVENPHGGYEYVVNEVIPPNEYHECVNNSFFTNALARWNILKAIELVESKSMDETTKNLLSGMGLTKDELAHWRDVADHIRIPYNEKRRMFPECDGFFELEDVDLRTFDHQRHGERQIIKQADVLMALYLLPELADPESFRRHYDYYVPRTDHGSSLSPGVHVLFSRLAGYRERMYDFFQKAGSIDAARRGHASDAGLHAASLGGGWQSLIFGFGGLAIEGDTLELDPDLPDHWTRLAFSVSFRGSRVRFDITQTDVRASLDSDAPSPVRCSIRGNGVSLEPGGSRTVRLSRQDQ